MFKKLKNKILPENNISSENRDLDLTKSLEKNMEMFKKVFHHNETIIYRTIETKGKDSIKGCVIFTDGMVNKEIINENIIYPIMNISQNSKISLDILTQKIICYGNMKKSKNVNELIHDILYGDTVLLMDHVSEGLIFDTKGWELRAISEPNSESVVRGPREGFTESISVNLSLIRRKILSADLKFVFKEMGRKTKTKVCITYMEGIASEKILDELIHRLDNIDIDGILESGYIEELVKDAPLSPFDTMGSTERPDVVASKLLEGRIALVFDGTPFVLTLPYIFMEYFQANEDYYEHFIYTSFNRLMRYIAFFLSTSVPAIYVALITYHQEMIPTPLLISISGAREGVPFPTIFEALAMGFVFEILREAGVRLPKPMGSAVSIVGALVLGDAAVNAKFVSAPMVIVTALTGISGLLIPQMLGPLIIMRVIFMIFSSFLGLYGYMFGIIGLFVHLVSIRSFGIPYMSNIGSINKQDIKDTLIRAPWWYMYYRPKLIGQKNRIRNEDYRMKGRR